MSSKTPQVTDALYRYWLNHGVKESAVMQALREETQKMEWAVMQISPEQGQFMQFLVKLLQVKNALEIGTFTGYSALAVASALPLDGKLIACDINKDWTDIAKKYWQQAGVDHLIDLRLAPALETLATLVQENAQFDFIFIDADKINYAAYFDASLKLLRSGGLILIDNVFFDGAVAAQDENIPKTRLPATRAIRALNARLKAEPGIDVCMLPIGDGLTLVRNFVE